MRLDIISGQLGAFVGMLRSALPEAAQADFRSVFAAGGPKPYEEAIPATRDRAAAADSGQEPEDDGDWLSSEGSDPLPTDTPDAADERRLGLSAEREWGELEELTAISYGDAARMQLRPDDDGADMPRKPQNAVAPAPGTSDETGWSSSSKLLPGLVHLSVVDPRDQVAPDVFALAETAAPARMATGRPSTGQYVPHHAARHVVPPPSTGGDSDPHRIWDSGASGMPDAAAHRQSLPHPPAAKASVTSPDVANDATVPTGSAAGSSLAQSPVPAADASEAGRNGTAPLSANRPGVGDVSALADPMFTVPTEGLSAHAARPDVSNPSKLQPRAQLRYADARGRPPATADPMEPRSSVVAETTGVAETALPRPLPRVAGPSVMPAQTGAPASFRGDRASAAVAPRFASPPFGLRTSDGLLVAEAGSALHAKADWTTVGISSSPKAESARTAEPAPLRARQESDSRPGLLSALSGAQAEPSASERGFAQAASPSRTVPVEVEPLLAAVSPSPAIAATDRIAHARPTYATGHVATQAKSGDTLSQAASEVVRLPGAAQNSGAFGVGVPHAPVHPRLDSAQSAKPMVDRPDGPNLAPQHRLAAERAATGYTLTTEATTPLREAPRLLVLRSGTTIAVGTAPEREKRAAQADVPQQSAPSRVVEAFGGPDTLSVGANALAAAPENVRILNSARAANTFSVRPLGEQAESPALAQHVGHPSGPVASGTAPDDRRRRSTVGAHEQVLEQVPPLRPERNQRHADPVQAMDGAENVACYGDDGTGSSRPLQQSDATATRTPPPASSTDVPAKSAVPSQMPQHPSASPALRKVFQSRDLEGGADLSALGSAFDALVQAHEAAPAEGRLPASRTDAAAPPVRAGEVIRQLEPALRLLPEGATQIQLSPEELGRVRLVMIPEGDRMLVHLTADRPETLDLLRRHTDQLSTSLHQAGFADVQYSFADGRRRATPTLPQAAHARPEPLPAEVSAPDRTRQAVSERLDLRL